MNGNEIIKSLELSTSAYRDIQPYSPHITVTFTDDEQDGVKYFLRKDGITLWITFRGTDEPREWKSNLYFSKKVVPYDNTQTEVRVHGGFLNSYKTPMVREKILESIAGDVRYIKVSGHSRGAALAVLCALDIQYNFQDRDIEVFLFGCPRIGNKAFAKSYNKRVSKTVRVENGNDIVTKVPLACMGYRHVGAKLHIGALSLPFSASTNDHYPHRYYSSLIKKILR